MSPAHAAPTSCRVTVETDAAGLHIDVSDEGPARPEVTILKDCQTGHGLVGMRERVSLYGGTMSAEPRSEGGFRVRAHLPSLTRRQP